MPRIVTAFCLAQLLVLAPAWGRSAPEDARLKQAATHFERGEQHYNHGEYAKAIRAFQQANQLAPHFRSLFNIARCYENLGDRVQALATYRRALQAPGIDAPSRADVEQRMRRLQSRPVKVFVSTRPPGATVTVDGAAQPTGMPTPTVVKLVPGEHVLLLRKPGYKLRARRLLVRMGEEQPVEEELEVDAGPCPPPAPCPCDGPCPKPPKRVDLHALHLHLHLLGAFGLTTNRPMAGGGGVQLLGSVRRFVFGGHFLGLPMGEERVDRIVGDISLERRRFSWLLGQVEAGYGFPFEHFYLYATGGVGISADRVSFKGTNVNTDEGDGLAKEKFAFVWSLGGGIEAMATSWLSFGGALRIGMAHGNRVDASNPDRSDSIHAPFGTLWGTATLHL